jgi:hypothetical protein
VCRDVWALWLLWQVCLAQWRARELGGDLGASPMKGHRALRITGLDAGPCIRRVLVYVSRFHYICELRELHYLSTFM